MSDTWYSKDLGDGVEAFEPTSEMMKAFFLALAAAGSPTDMALFSCYDHHRNIVTAFFSPAASAIAKKFGATPCGKPPREGLSLSVGGADSMSVLFTEK